MARPMTSSATERVFDRPLEEIERYSQELDLQLRLLKDQLRDADRQILALENDSTDQEHLTPIAH